MKEVETRCGKIRGVAAGNPEIMVYKGIPYAEPPVGKLRWRPPVPKKKWEGVLDASRYGNICPQILPAEGTFYYNEFFKTECNETQSEDCLQLNIWTAAKSPKEKLPVLIFIHGGGFQTNYSFAPQFDGENMAAHGVVVVSINYRLGVFGFLAHPDLIEESEKGLAGNYGLLDQICACQWVRDNIHFLGGDPEKITISGGSAGAESVMLLSLSDLTRGWFQRAIMQSGPLLESRTSLKESAEDGKKFLERLGYSSIEEARNVDADILKTYGPDLDKGDRMFLAPCIDGYVLSEEPIQAIKHGKQHDMDYLTGCNKDEGKSMRNRFYATLEELQESMKKCYGEYNEEYLKHVSFSTTEEAKEFQLVHGFTENMYVYCLAWCELQKEDTDKKCYLYHFDRELPGDDNGAFHACEHWYVFETLKHCWRDFKGEDYELSEVVAKYWSNFVKTGTPNGEGLPVWIPYDKKHQGEMRLNRVCQMSAPAITGAIAARVKYFCD